MTDQAVQKLQERYREIKASITTVRTKIHYNQESNGPEEWTDELKAEQERLLARLDEVHLLLERCGGELP